MCVRNLLLQILNYLLIFSVYDSVMRKKKHVKLRNIIVDHVKFCSVLLTKLPVAITIKTQAQVHNLYNQQQRVPHCHSAHNDF